MQLVKATQKKSGRVLAGVDEAGRGPLAGPVVAAAVILNPRRPIRGLDDSKVLDAKERERLAELIHERAIAWAIGWADREEIDAINILQATFLAMRRALLGLQRCPDLIKVDGNRLPVLADVLPECRATAVVQGDSLVPAISAASILAKTYRDAWMCRMHAQYPQYGFDAHKGYGTPAHLEALKRHGICPQHRLSFAPVRNAAGFGVVMIPSSSGASSNAPLGQTLDSSRDPALDASLDFSLNLALNGIAA